MRKENHFKIIALFFSLVFGFGIFEIILRLCPPLWLKQRMETLNPAQKNLHHFGSDLDWSIEKKEGRILKFSPNHHFRVTHYEYDHMVHIDEWGGRQVEACRDNNIKEAIPFVGDSFLFGIGVPDNETFVNQLSAKLNRCFLNLGLPGSDPIDQIKLIYDRHQELRKPKKYVMIFFIGNDFAFKKINPKLVSKDAESSTSEKPSNKWINRLNDFSYNQPLLKNSYLLQYTRAKALLLYNHLLILQGNEQKIAPIFEAMKKNNRDQVEIFLNYLTEEIRTLSKNLGIQILFVTIPDKHQIYPEVYLQRMHYYGFASEDIDPQLPNKILASTFKDKQIDLFDATSCLIKSSDKRLYYTQDNHLTKKGHRIISECIMPHVHRFLSS